jgi:filamentous hemagglutinin family protein
LNANGRVFILNSAGITFAGTSRVNVGALLATTAMTVNGDPSLSASYSGTG